MNEKDENTSLRLSEAKFFSSHNRTSTYSQITPTEVKVYISMSDVFCLDVCDVFSVVGPSIWNGLPLVLCAFSRTHSQALVPHLKMVLIGRSRGEAALSNRHED